MIHNISFVSFSRCVLFRTFGIHFVVADKSVPLPLSHHAVPFAGLA